MSSLIEEGLIPIDERLPDFRVHGFHTGRKVMVRRDDGSEHEVEYHGYCIFGSGIYDVTHWKPIKNMPHKTSE